MNLQRLRAFRALMVAGSVTKAAERLRLTQPAVSRLLSALENEVGFRLFVRRRGRLVATLQGDALYRESERILHGIDDLQRIIREIRTNTGSQIRIVSMPPLARGFLPRAVAAFAAEYPELKVSLETRPRRDVENWVAGLQFDVGLASLPVQHPGLSSRPFATCGAVAVLPPNHRLVAKENLSISDFADEPFVSLDQTSLVRHVVDAVFYEYGVAPQIRFETSSAHVAAQFVAQGLGIAILDPFSASVLGDQVTVRTWDPMPRLTYGLLFPNDARPSPTLERFAAVVRETAAEFGRQHPGAALELISRPEREYRPQVRA